MRRRDEDCDGKVDESSVAEPAEGSTFWFADCDGDGFAPTGALSVRTCVKPSAADTACNSENAAWASTSPQAKADCADQDAKAFPGQTAYSVAPIAGTTDDYDFDCDSKESVDFGFSGLTKPSPGSNDCTAHVRDWIIATRDVCYDYVTGYSASCGKTVFTVQLNYDTGGGRYECGDTAAVCEFAYDVPVTCR